MEPTAIGLRLASAVVGPLVRKFFVTEAPGAGLVDEPVRLSGYVSFRGEKSTLTASDVRALAGTLVRQALRGGERRVPADEEEAVTDALAATLHALGDLTITDVDAVRLGPEAFARELRRAGDHPERHLSADAAHFYQALLGVAVLHILEFFTQRKTFTAHALVSQTRAVHELTAKTDELIRRSPLPDAADVAFEAAYLPYVAKKHAKLTIYGIDLSSSPTRWPLDVAYLSLEAAPPWNAQRAFEAFETAEDFHDARRAALHRLPGGRPADQALGRTPRVLLRGEAGSGKTTLVQWLAVTAAQQDRPDRPEYLQGRVPFVLPLRTLTRHGERLPAPKDFLTATGCPLAGSQPAGWEHRVLTAGRGLILVDGIDEIPEPERERTRRWLLDLLDTYDGDNRWLVTSRPSAVGENWLAEDGFDELTLSSMGPADIATFIERWHAAAAGGRPDEEAELSGYQAQLLTAVRTKSDLGRLATNPLMCGLICALHRDRRGYLPHGRKDLYEAALSMLISRRDRERDMRVPDLREEPQLELLQRLAYWLIKNGRTEMDRSQAEAIIGRALSAVPEAAELGDARTVFEHFLQRSGLLREPAPGTVDFVHRTFQDFLGARAAVEEGDFGLLAAHAADDQWEDVIRMAVALARPRERVGLFEDLLNLGDDTDDQHTRFRVYLLAAACLEHATTLDPSVRAAVEERARRLIPPRDAAQARALAEVGPLVLDLLPGPEALRPWEARNTVVTASRVASDAALPFLAGYAAHPSLEVRSQLMWAWSRYDTARYAEEVIARLDPDGLYYTVTSDEQLHHLDRLAVRVSSLDVRAEVSVDTLDSYLSRHSLTALRIMYHPVEDLGLLARQTGLEAFAALDCPDLTDLSPLTGLPLRELNIAVPTAVDLRPLASLSELSYLRIGGSAPLVWSPESLHPHAPLRELYVTDAVTSERGLEGIQRFTELEALELTDPLLADDWRVIADLPSLRSLTLDAASLTTLPAGMTLPLVTTLFVENRHRVDLGRHVIDRIPLVFPHLDVAPGLAADLASY